MPSKKHDLFEEDGEMIKVRKATKGKADAAAKPARKSKAKDRQLDVMSAELEVMAAQDKALVEAEAAADPISATIAVVEKDWQAELAAMLPERKPLVQEMDVMDLLSSVSFELVAAEQAEEHMAEGRRCKAEARAIMDTIVKPLKADIDTLQLEFDGYVADVDKIRDEIREDLFSNPELAKAVKLLEGHPQWGKFAESMEKRVLVILARDYAALLGDRDAAAEVLRDLKLKHESETERANEWGRQGTAAFAVGEEILRANGFAVQKHSQPKAR
jgi:hypothetical protein